MFVFVLNTQPQFFDILDTFRYIRIVFDILNTFRYVRSCLRPQILDYFHNVQQAPELSYIRGCAKSMLLLVSVDKYVCICGGAASRIILDPRTWF